ncbi:MAG: class I SAM-dependent methyltransferase [Patescibacteria group bacterium]
MFNQSKSKLHSDPRYGKAETPSAHEFTLEKYYDLYNRAVEGDEAIQTLVLGATPELRDIVLSYDHHLTTIDNDALALQEKTAMMHFKNSPHETIIISDWLTMDFPANSFDVILGDGALTALKKDEQKTLLNILNHIIKPTGSIILREEAEVNHHIQFSPQDMVHNYRSGQYNIFDLFFGLRLHNKNYKGINPETHRLRLKDFLNKLTEYRKNNIISRAEFEHLSHVAEELEHTLLSKSEIEHILKGHFQPKEIIHDIGSGHLSPWYFFLHQPKE